MEAKKKQEAEKRLADKRGGREASNSAIVPLERWDNYRKVEKLKGQ